MKLHLRIFIIKSVNKLIDNEIKFRYNVFQQWQ